MLYFTIVNKNISSLSLLVGTTVVHSCFNYMLTVMFMINLKAPITTEADDKFCDIFPSFRKKIRCDISCLICYFEKKKKQQNFELTSAANYRWRFKIL